jgi:hypothetical protein
MVGEQGLFFVTKVPVFARRLGTDGDPPLIRSKRSVRSAVAA